MKNKVYIIIFVLVVVGLVIGGLYFYNKSNSTKQEATKKIIFDEKADDSTADETVPTEAAAPTPDLSQYEISILNGSGVAGKAGEVKTSLEEKGFKVVSVGNAKEYDYTKTEISYKKDVKPAYLDALKTALEEQFAVADPTALTASDEGEVVITIGSETAVE